MVLRLRDRRRKIDWYTGKQYVLLEILVPKNNEKGPISAESMFASLHGIFESQARIQEKISFEIVARKGLILFYVWTSSHLRDFVEAQIYAQYPTVEIRETSDLDQLEPATGSVASVDLLLNKSDVYPIKTFLNFEVDPLASITGVLSKVSSEDSIYIQVIIRPVSDTWRERGISWANAFKGGLDPSKQAISRMLSHGLINFGKLTLDTALGRVSEENQTSNPAPAKLSGPDTEAVKGIEAKTTKLGFATKIRIMAFSQDVPTAVARINGVTGAFKQFNTTNLNGFVASPVRTDAGVLDDYRKRIMGREYVFNIEELASVFHLPNISVETPTIAWAGSKKGEPPTNLPVEGSVDKSDLTLFAQTNFRHLVHRFGVKNDDRRLHFYAIGKTGTGKSTMLENMIIHDIRAGRGVAVVDPHGDLIDHILDFIPEHRVKDVVWFAPWDREHPIGFNPLEAVDIDLKPIVASGVVGIFKKIFGESWGPRLEYILRNTILSLLDYPNATLLGVTRVLVDKDFRQDVIKHIKDPIIRNFWINEFERYDPKFRVEAVAPIQNKVGQFLSTATIRNIVGQPRSTISMDDLMDGKKILLLDLSIGKIGEDTSALLGALMITKIQIAALSRANVPEDRRIDFYLYVDEFQNFATDSFAVILSEARKYRLNLIMTNQFIAQMPEIVADAIFGNVGTIISFRVGPQDATTLVKEFEPIFEANDLVNLDNYNVYVKMSIEGVTSPPFSAMTLPPSRDRSDFRQKAIEHSRLKYSLNRDDIEEDIMEWSKPIKIQLGQPAKSAQAVVAQEPKNLTAKPSIVSLGPKTYQEFIDRAGGRWFASLGSLPKVDQSSNPRLKTGGQALTKVQPKETDFTSQTKNQSGQTDRSVNDSTRKIDRAASKTGRGSDQSKPDSNQGKTNDLKPGQTVSFD